MELLTMVIAPKRAKRALLAVRELNKNYYRYARGSSAVKRNRPDIGRTRFDPSGRAALLYAACTAEKRNDETSTAPFLLDKVQLRSSENI